MLTVFKSIKLWQVLVLVLVVAGGAGGSYWAFAAAGGTGQSALAKNQQLIPVQLGDLVNKVSTSGSLLFPNKEALTFGTQGTVAEVLVQEGQAVEAGQPLARLDAAAIASLEKTVAQARVNLRNTENTLEDAKFPHSAQEIAQAEVAAANARLALRNAQDALAGFKEKFSQEELDRAKANLDSATRNLASTIEEAAIARKDRDKKLAAAGDATATKEGEYSAVFNKWLGMPLTAQQTTSGPAALLAALGVNLAAIYDPQSRFADLGRWVDTQGPPADDPATPWNEVAVYAWLNLSPANIQATCEKGALLPKGDACIMKEMEDAWEAVQAARDAQAALKNQSDKSTTKEDGSITQAQDALKAAQESLDTLKAGPDPLELDVKVKQVAAAQANLEKSEADLVEMLEAPDPLDTELRQKDIAAAQAALDTTLERLEGATLTAPIKGIVTAMNIEAGQAVNANTPAIEIADTTVVEMDGVVDEIDVLFVQEGAQAVITMDALPGQTLAGTVTSIASAARTQQGVVTYPIRVQLQVPEGVQLREGLSATADIVIREDKGMLLIPTQAVYGSFQQPTVKLMKGGRVEEQPVTLGNSDDFWVAVTAGLSQGDRILMETAQVSTTGQINVRPGQGGFGGAGGLAGLTGAGGGGQAFQGQGGRNTNRDR